MLQDPKLPEHIQESREAMTLQSQVENAQRHVRTDGYSMSIGEIVSMYENDEITISPPFQRLFRWEVGQKSKFVESILLGIPIPPIFVFEADDGTWELIDGLQRTSTILEFMGLLKSADGLGRVPPSYLEGTRYLPKLEGAVWELTDNIENFPRDQQIALSKPLQLAIRRAKLSVQILKRPSDPETKYDLFQRLNRGATIANAQEVRNCVVIMIDENVFLTIQDLSANQDFRALTHISESGELRQRDLEMAMRFLVFISYEYQKGMDVEEFLDNYIVKIAEGEKDIQSLSETFEKTFSIIRSSLGDGGLQKWNPQTQSFGGRVGQVALEVVAAGIGNNIENITRMADPEAYVSNRVKAFWASEEGSAYMAAGIRGTQRLAQTLQLGRRWFSE